MPLYMDRHDLPPGTADEAARAHILDLETQERYGVRYVSYWCDNGTGATFCLVEGPDMQTVEMVHREAHGLVASQIIEVDGSAVAQFLGRVQEPPVGEPWAETAFRTILFTDIEGSTSLTQRLGDGRAMAVLRTHDSVVRGALTRRDGLEVKHTGDGIMASFRSVVGAVTCAIDVQRRLAELNEDTDVQLIVRIGISAGEPVTENDDLFGSVVNLAARLCSAATGGGIYVSNAVRELTLGKGFSFEDRGTASLKGFEEPVQLYEVRWGAGRA
ncbi:MAG: nickel-binding protein [Actinomycetota bacterium]